jgi:MFS family permease
MQKNLNKFYLYEIFQSLSFAFVPIFMLFMVGRGLTYSEIGILIAIHYGLFFVFELPTGALADRFGRKNTLVIGLVLKVIALILFVNAWSFWAFVVVEAVLSLSRSMVVGSDSAFIYDHLLHHKQESQFKSIKGKIRLFNNYSHTISGLIGAYVATYNLEAVFYFAMVMAIISTIYACSLEENVIIQKEKTHQQGYLKHIWLSLIEVKKSKQLLWLIAYSAFLFFLLRASLATLIQPLLIALEMPEYSFNLVDAALALGAGTCSIFVYKSDVWFKKNGVYIFFPITLAISFFGIWYFQNLFSILFYFFTMIGWSWQDPVMQDAFNHNITDSSKRATILSVDNLVSRSLFGILVIFLGFGLDTYGIFNMNLILAVTAVLGGILLINLKPKAN